MAAEPMSEEDYDSEAESEEDLDWLLGFVDPPRSPTDLLRHRFPSKVGGRPAWLDPARLPSRQQLTCGATGRPLQFLIQVYAPVDGLPSAFHRALYVFISPEGGQLARAGAVRALRCQLPRRNPYYAYDPPAHADACPPALSPAQLAAALARDPWQAARHESPAAAAPAADGAAGAAAAPTGGGAAGGGGITAPALLPELELIVEPEPGPSSEDDSRVEAALAQYRQRTAEEGAYDEEELPASLVDSLEDAVGPEQRHFAAFAARVAKEPSQVLRYCFDEGAAPLCPAAAGVPPAAGVPRCPACAAPRRFEFQVMPQLLNHLEADAADPDAPDWGALAVYSCSASCCGGGGGGGGGGGIEPEGQDGSAYLEEYVWVQPSA